MDMQIKLFSIPIFGSDKLEDELNRFLRGHRILQVERHFCPDNGGYWAIFIEYADYAFSEDSAPVNRKEKKDMTKDLNEDERKRFESFRNRRREIAQAKSIPAYMVFTDAELAVLAKVDHLNPETAKGLQGIAPNRVRDYVNYFFEKENGKESGELDVANSKP